MNPVSALTGATTDQVLDDELVRGFCSRAMTEAAAIGARIGCEVRESPQDRYAVTRRLGAFKTSMLQDVEALRPIELDALIGAVREIGQRVGVATPNCDALFGSRACSVGCAAFIRCDAKTPARRCDAGHVCQTDPASQAPDESVRQAFRARLRSVDDRRHLWRSRGLPARRAAGKHPAFWAVFQRPLTEQWIWAALTPLVLFVAHRFPLARPALARAIVVHVAAFLLLSLLHCVVAGAVGGRCWLSRRTTRARSSSCASWRRSTATSGCTGRWYASRL